MTKIRKGFTLIELLVVIAIIGILATIIIINVTAARGKAVNARVLSDLGTAQKVAASCMVSGYYFLDLTGIPPGGILWGANIQIISVDVGICTNTIASASMSQDVPGRWPTIGTYGNASNGVAWAYTISNSPPHPQLTTTNAPSFSFGADATPTPFNPAVPPIGISCTQTGCTKSGW